MPPIDNPFKDTPWFLNVQYDSESHVAQIALPIIQTSDEYKAYNIVRYLADDVWIYHCGLIDALGNDYNYTNLYTE